MDDNVFTVLSPSLVAIAPCDRAPKRGRKESGNTGNGRFGSVGAGVDHAPGAVGPAEMPGAEHRARSHAARYWLPTGRFVLYDAPLAEGGCLLCGLITRMRERERCGQ